MADKIGKKEEVSYGEYKVIIDAILPYINESQSSTARNAIDNKDLVMLFQNLLYLNSKFKEYLKDDKDDKSYSEIIKYLSCYIGLNCNEDNLRDIRRRYLSIIRSHLEAASEDPNTDYREATSKADELIKEKRKNDREKKRQNKVCPPTTGVSTESY